MDFCGDGHGVADVFVQLPDLRFQFPLDDILRFSEAFRAAIPAPMLMVVWDEIFQVAAWIRADLLR